MARVRKRSGPTGCSCCSAPQSRAVERRQSPCAAGAEVQHPPSAAARRPDPLSSRLEPEPEPELMLEHDVDSDTEDMDEYFSCSAEEDDNDRAAVIAGSCCPPEHLGTLSLMVAEFGADATPPVTHTLWRFLCARKYSLVKASELYRQHLEWRRSGAIPTQPTAKQIAALEAARLPASSAGADGRRFYRLDARDGDGGVMICCVLAAWLGLAPAELDEWLGAYLLFIEQTAKIADEHPDPMQRRWTVICDCSGLGPTAVPLKFLQRLNAAFEPNYPERLKRTVMLPIPGFVVAFINGLLAFVDETTRAKFCMVRDASGLAKACGVLPEVLPATLRAH